MSCQPQGRPDAAGTTCVVIIPSYNTGPRLVETVRAARRHWAPVWVVIDGSTDGSDAPLMPMAASDPELRVIRLEQNSGKGAAILRGLEEAADRGFTHVVTMDADGQHPADRIPGFVAAACAQPESMILGVPEFDATAPRLRVRGRRISNGWANLETLWSGVGDSLFGMRAYPIAPLLAIMHRTRWMRRYDFDAEAAVRMSWAGVRPVNLPTPVRYFTADEGGVSHFHYVRDNALLSWMHARLMFGFVVRLPWLAVRRMLHGY